MSVRANMRELWRRVSSIDAGDGQTAVRPAADAGVAVGAEPVSRGTACVAEADAGEPAAFRGDAGGAAGDQPDQGPRGGMEWQVRLRGALSPEMPDDAAERMAALRWSLEEPNESDSFRTLMEQVLEDVLVGGFGAVEMELTGDPERPLTLWPVDGATIRINPKWDGRRRSPRYAQANWLHEPDEAGAAATTTVDVRADESAHAYAVRAGAAGGGVRDGEQFLSAHRFAGKLASNSVVQYALWLNEATPAQHERLIRWWQDEIEGTGRVPLLSTEQKPEVLRFAQGTDADLRLAVAGVPDPHGGECVRACRRCCWAWRTM